MNNSYYDVQLILPGKPGNKEPIWTQRIRANADKIQVFMTTFQASDSLCQFAPYSSPDSVQNLWQP